MKTLKQHLDEFMVPQPQQQPQSGTEPPPTNNGGGEDQPNNLADMPKVPKIDTEKVMKSVTVSLDKLILQLKTDIIKQRPNIGEKWQGFKNFFGDVKSDLQAAGQPIPYQPTQPNENVIDEISLKLYSILEYSLDKLNDRYHASLNEAGNANWQGTQSNPYSRRGGNQLDTQKVDGLLTNFRSNLLKMVKTHLDDLNLNQQLRFVKDTPPEPTQLQQQVQQQQQQQPEQPKEVSKESITNYLQEEGSKFVQSQSKEWMTRYGFNKNDLQKMQEIGADISDKMGTYINDMKGMSTEFGLATIINNAAVAVNRSEGEKYGQRYEMMIYKMITHFRTIAGEQFSPKPDAGGGVPLENKIYALEKTLMEISL